MRAQSLIAVSIISLLALAGCASNKPRTADNGGLGNNIHLGKSDSDSTLVYRNPNINVTKYHGIFIDQAEIYTGEEADFGGATPEQKALMANYLTEEFTRILGKGHHVVSEPGPGIIKLHLILVGYSESRPALSTALRLTPIGLAMTLGKSVTDMPATFTGSATFSASITDGETGEVLGAFLTKQSPPAYELTSGLGTEKAAKQGITQGAEGFAKALDRAAGRAQ